MKNFIIILLFTLFSASLFHSYEISQNILNLAVKNKEQAGKIVEYRKKLVRYEHRINTNHAIKKLNNQLMKMKAMVGYSVKYKNKTCVIGQHSSQDEKFSVYPLKDCYSRIMYIHNTLVKRYDDELKQIMNRKRERYTI